MDCDEVMDRLSEYFDGELAPAAARRIDQHVADCRSCAEELRSFSAIGELVNANANANAVRTSPAPHWEGFSERWASHPVKQRKAAPSLPARRLTSVIAAVALAASLLFVFGLPSSFEKPVAGPVPVHVGHGHSDAGVAINFQPFLVGPTSHPVAAYHALRAEFAGQEAAADEAKGLLGYEPSIMQALPDGIQLISTHVLKLPQCNCAGGQCTCGPGGCNCAAFLCVREDGSNLLLVEHCLSQRISFGDVDSEVVRHQSQEFEWLKSGTQHAATWIANDRRLTAIGLTGKGEAASLVTSVASL